MLELLKQLIQSWAIAYINRKIRKLEMKLTEQRDKLNKKVNPD